MIRVAAFTQQQQLTFWFLVKFFFFFLLQEQLGCSKLNASATHMNKSNMSTLQQANVSSPNHGMWSSVFVNDVSCVSHSTLFISQLVSVALSTITYLRNLFPETAYTDKVIDGLNLKLLMSNNQHIGPNTFVENIVACFEALEKQYLREMKLLIYEHDPDFPLEVYTFKFNYQDGSASVSNLKLCNKKRKSTLTIQMPVKKMLRSIIMAVQSFDDLPDSVIFGFKLFYYDDVTPSDYEPVGFLPVVTLQAKFPSNAVNIISGNVQTLYHKMQLKVTTTYISSYATEIPDVQPNTQCMLSSNSSNDNDKQQNSSWTPSYEPEIHYSERASRMRKKKHILDFPFDVRGENTQSDQNLVRQFNTSKTCSLHSLFGREDVIRCPCGVCREDGPMIKCTLCDFRQHAVCFRLLEVNYLQSNHVCELCANVTHPCTDYSLVNTDLCRVRETCLFRRLLIHLCNNTDYHTAASVAELLHVTFNMGKRLMVRLQSEGVLACKPCNE
nr:HORMA domain-containing protein 2-like isoform X2 [Cherax quadricarinatus]